jgi:hypothetical protein
VVEIQDSVRTVIENHKKVPELENQINLRLWVENQINKCQGSQSSEKKHKLNNTCPEVI